MSKLLKDFHKNLRNLSQMNLEKPPVKYKLDSNWNGNGLKLLPYSSNSLSSSSNSTIATSKNDDKDSVKSSTTSGKSSR